MKNCTLGFIFSPDFQHVLLIHKTHPEWQAGKLNGLGGKIENEETPFQGISREVLEESGLHIPPEEWRLIARMEGRDPIVDVLFTVFDGSRNDAQSRTDECVEWFPTSSLPHLCISNLRWLIPLCINVAQNDQTAFVIIKQTEQA